MKMLFVPIIFIALSLMHSCTDFKEEAMVSFGVDTKALSFSFGGGTQSLNVTSGSKWDVQTKPQWISLGSINQSGTSPFEWTVNFTASVNEGFDRDGIIQVKSKSETASISVSQAGQKGKYVPVESVSISPTELTLTEGEYASLSYVINPSSASVKDVSWHSDSPEVATVNSLGRVDAVSEGTAIITCTTSEGGKAATCVVKVNAKVVVSLDQTEVSLKEEETLKLNATISPSSVKTSLVWTSRDETIATVSSDGTITAVLEGTTTIMVESEEGGNIATCDLTVTAEYINFKDANFKKFIIDNFDLNKNGKISLSEGKRIKRIEINTDNIESVQGIEMLQELRILNCSGSRYFSTGDNSAGLLTTLDISNNLKLEELNCEANHLSALDILNNTSLKLLKCGENAITSLDLSKNKSLTYLECDNNRLAFLDVTNNKALTYLKCSRNYDISSLDISKNISLRTLYCDHISLAKLDVSNNNSLTDLDCEGNNITKLSLSSSIEQLSCGYNKLSELDLSLCTALDYLFCRGNRLTALDLSKNRTLTRLYCGDNQITTLIVPPSIRELDCEKNKLTSLDLSNYTSLNRLYCHSNNLTSLDISKNADLDMLGCNPMNNDSLEYIYMAKGQNVPRIFDVPSYTQILRK